MSDAREANTGDVDDLLVQASPPKRLWEYVFFQASPQVSHEQAQCLARIAISAGLSLILAGLWWAGWRGVAAHWHFIWITAVYAVVSVGYYGILRRFRERYLWRRYAMIGADLGLAAAGTYYFGLSGIAFYPIFLWVTIGNGLRFGEHLLRVAVAVGLAGFVLATWANGVLIAHPAVVAGLLIGLLLMPKFFLVMIQRLAAANEVLRTEKGAAEHRAMHDELTGLPSRALLQDRLDLALRKMARREGRLAVVFIDLDGFKAINDNLGHDAGDRLLQQIADCLQQRVRASDTVARLGGDEFIVLVEDCGSPENVAAVVDQLARCVGRYYLVEGHHTFVNWSCGMAIYPEDGSDAGSLIKHADTAMYRAKAEGRGQARFYNADMTAQLTRQFVLRDDLRRALDAGDLEVHYQPVIRLDRGEAVDIEALLRWRHPQRGLLAAEAFIGTAEQTGLVIELGRWVFDRVTRDLAEWRRNGHLSGVKVYVNVSPRQLADGSFLADLLGRLEERGLASADVGLDLAEDALLTDGPRARDLLTNLRERGFSLALDNFGGGRSSLGHLRRMPLQRLKIDRSFLQEAPQNPRDRALVEAILVLGERLGLEVVAQGVGSDTQHDWLRRAGCQLAQGFFYGPPRPASALPGRLEDFEPRAGTAGQ